MNAVRNVNQQLIGAAVRHHKDTSISMLLVVLLFLVIVGSLYLMSRWKCIGGK
jgi:hypothetical protein